MIYFDNSATTLKKPKKVLRKLFILSRLCSNVGRSGHKPSMFSSKVIYNTREEICNFFNFQKPWNVVFTYNASYALNMAINGYILEKCHILSSIFEHNSVIRPLNALKDCEVTYVSSDLYDNNEFLKNFTNSIREDTKFAVINHVSNVFGYILPIKELDEICFEHNIKLILDLSQSAGILKIDLSEFKSVCAVCMPAHKALYGIMGLGVLIVLDDDIKPFIFGGTGSNSFYGVQPDFLPDMLESGTPNVLAIGALFEGVRYVKNFSGLEEDLFFKARYLACKLSHFDDTIVYFKDDIALQTGVISFNHKKFDCEIIAYNFAQKNICVRSGFHCAPLCHSYFETNGTVRVSFSSFNTYEEIDNFIRAYRKIIKKLS